MPLAGCRAISWVDDDVARSLGVPHRMRIRWGRRGESRSREDAGVAGWPVLIGAAGAVLAILVGVLAGCTSQATHSRLRREANDIADQIGARQGSHLLESFNTKALTGDSLGIRVYRPGNMVDVAKDVAAKIGSAGYTVRPTDGCAAMMPTDTCPMSAIGASFAILVTVFANTATAEAGSPSRSAPALEPGSVMVVYEIYVNK